MKYSEGNSDLLVGCLGEFEIFQNSGNLTGCAKLCLESGGHQKYCEMRGAFASSMPVIWATQPNKCIFEDLEPAYIIIADAGLSTWSFRLISTPHHTHCLSVRISTPCVGLFLIGSASVNRPFAWRRLSLAHLSLNNTQTKPTEYTCSVQPDP